MARGSYVGGPGDSFAFAWQGRKIVQDWEDRVLLPVLEDCAREAEQVAEEVWNPEDHPYMHGPPGVEQQASYYLVEPNENGTVSLVIGSDVDHALYHELGFEKEIHRADGGTTTVVFGGHRTLGKIGDAIAPRIAPKLRAASKAAGY